MHTYRIVVGVDGSDGGQRALNWAVREASQRGGTVLAISTWAYGAADSAETGYADALHAACEQILRTAISVAVAEHPHVTVTAEVIVGDPAHALTTAARGADLLVLGSHGHNRLHHAILGSVTGACIRAGTCPVLVVPVPSTTLSAMRRPATAAVVG